MIFPMKKYNLIGYKGKQVRDNLHSNDLVNCFWQFYKKPRYVEIYNMGGGRYSNCSIIEALDYVEKSLSGLLEPDIKETVLGSAEIQKIFKG